MVLIEMGAKTITLAICEAFAMRSDRPMTC